LAPASSAATFSRFVRAHRQHDHRHLRPLRSSRQHLMAVEVGQAEVEDHQVGAMRRQACRPASPSAAVSTR
jgi:hypothetical protein